MGTGTLIELAETSVYLITAVFLSLLLDQFLPIIFDNSYSFLNKLLLSPHIVANLVRFALTWQVFCVDLADVKT